MKHVSSESGTSKSGKRRSGSVLIVSTPNVSEGSSSPTKKTGFQGIGVGAGYDHVEHKLDVFKSEYVSQIDNYDVLASDLTKLATSLDLGHHEDAHDGGSTPAGDNLAVLGVEGTEQIAQTGALSHSGAEVSGEVQSGYSRGPGPEEGQSCREM